MPAGLEIYNDAGTVQLDASSVTHTLVASGAAASGPKQYQFGNSTANITYTGTAPLLAFRPGSGDAALMQTSVSGNTHTWTINCSGAVGTPIEYWIFDMVPLGTLGYGIEIYNEVGSLVYATQSKPIRVIDLLQSSTYWGAVGPNVSYPVSKVAALFARQSGRRVWLRQGTTNIFLEQQYTMAVASAAPNNLSFRELLSGQATSSSLQTAITFGASSVVILDVSNY